MSETKPELKIEVARISIDVGDGVGNTVHAKISANRTGDEWLEVTSRLWDGSANDGTQALVNAAIDQIRKMYNAVAVDNDEGGVCLPRW